MTSHYNRDTHVITQNDVETTIEEHFKPTYTKKERERNLIHHVIFFVIFIFISWYQGIIKNNEYACLGFFIAALSVSNSYGLSKKRDKSEDRLQAIAIKLHRQLEKLKETPVEENTNRHCSRLCDETLEGPITELIEFKTANMSDLSSWLKDRANYYRSYY